MAMPGAESHETRDFARETKFLVDAAKADGIRAWAREHLARDPSGEGPTGDEYSTTSLYFDTKNYDVYYQRRSYKRAKYRIRRYGLSDVVFLERKFRSSRLLAKRRTIVPVKDLAWLDEAKSDTAWPGHWFHRRLLLRGLQPIMQFSYTRVARLGQAENGPVRLTLDTNLRALPMFDKAFIPGVGVPVTPFMNNQVVLELKYRVELPALFRKLVEEFKLSRAKVSKYRQGLGALNLTPQAPDRDAPESEEEDERPKAGAGI